MQNIVTLPKQYSNISLNKLNYFFETITVKLGLPINRMIMDNFAPFKMTIQHDNGSNVCQIQTSQSECLPNQGNRLL